MRARILIAHSDPSMAVLLDGLVGELAGEGLSIDPDATILVAHARRADAQIGTVNPELVVLDAHLAPDGQTPRDPRSHRGVELLRQWRSRQVSTPVLLVVDAENELLSMLGESLAPCEIVAASANLLSALREQIALLASAARAEQTRPDETPPEPGRLRATIELTLTGERKRFKVEYSGARGFELDPIEGDLRPADPKEYDALLRRMKLWCPTNRNWYEELKDHGASLFRQLFGQGGVPWAAVLQQVGSLDRVGIRVSVGGDDFGLAFESLHDSEQERFLLEVALGARKLISSFSQYRSPRFNDLQRIRILCITSDVGEQDDISATGDAIRDDVRNRSFPNLDYLYNERSIFEGLDQTRVEVTFLPEKAGKPERPLRDLLREKLRPPGGKPAKFDIVHYAGHSLFVEDPAGPARGYLLLAGPKGVADAVPVERIADWASDTDMRLFYLSSCRSGSWLSASEMARQQVPAFIGYRWDLDDNRGYEFAQVFYRELISPSRHGSVAEAFREARRELAAGAQRMTDPTWAIATLVMQNQRWAAR